MDERERERQREGETEKVKWESEVGKKGRNDSMQRAKGGERRQIRVISASFDICYSQRWQRQQDDHRAAAGESGKVGMTG